MPLHFVTRPSIFLPVHIRFIRPNDGWTGLYIKLCWLYECCNERQCVADGGDEQGTIVAGPGGLTIDPNIQYQIRADTGQGQWLLHGMCVVHVIEVDHIGQFQHRTKLSKQLVYVFVKCYRVLESTSHYIHVQITAISTAILLASNPRIRLIIQQLQDDSAQYSSSDH